MSAAEQAEAIGRSMLAASECKRKVAALRVGLTGSVEKLNAASKMVSAVLVGQNYRPMDIEEAIQSIPSPQSVLELVQEFKTESERSRALQEQIQGFNL